MMEVLIQLNEQRHHARAAKLSDATALLMVNAREQADNAAEPAGNAYDDLASLLQDMMIYQSLRLNQVNFEYF